MSGVLLLWFELSWKNSEYLFTSHSNHQCVKKDEKKAKGNQANLWHACNTTFKPLRSFPWMNFPSIFRSVCCQLSRLSSITVAFLEPKLSWKNIPWFAGDFRAPSLQELYLWKAWCQHTSFAGMICYSAEMTPGFVCWCHARGDSLFPKEVEHG